VLSGTISGWESGDVIDLHWAALSDVAFDGTTVSFTAGGQSYAYDVAGLAPGMTVVAQSDGARGTELMLAPASSTVVSGGTLQFATDVTSGGTITFAEDTTGTLGLAKAQNFIGTVAGFAAGDAMDLENFHFSSSTIASVSGTGAAGTDTLVTIESGTLTATIALINQYAGEFGADPSAYTLASDQNGRNPGTVLELAAPHST
jgi:hypothetical protein